MTNPQVSRRVQLTQLLAALALALVAPLSVSAADFYAQATVSGTLGYYGGDPTLFPWTASTMQALGSDYWGLICDTCSEPRGVVEFDIRNVPPGPYQKVELILREGTYCSGAGCPIYDNVVNVRGYIGDGGLTFTDWNRDSLLVNTITLPSVNPDPPEYNRIDVTNFANDILEHGLSWIGFRLEPTADNTLEVFPEPILRFITSSEPGYLCQGDTAINANADDHVAILVKLSTTGYPSEHEGIVGLHIRQPDDPFQPSPPLDVIVRHFAGGDPLSNMPDTVKIYWTPKGPAVNGNLRLEWVGPTHNDEFCTVKIFTNAKSAAHYSQIAEACNQSAWWHLSGSLVEAGLAGAAVLVPPAQVGLVFLVGVSGGVTDLATHQIAAAADEICHDPPDSNYQEIVTLVSPIPPMPGFPAAEGSGVSASMASALNAYAESLGEAAAQSLALVRSIRKQAGARAADDDVWENRQADSVARYRRGLSATLNRFAAALRAVRDAFAEEGFWVMPGGEQLAALHATPLSIEQVEWLRSAGADDALIDEIEYARITGERPEVAAPFPDVLSDPKIHKSLMRFAGMLGIPGGMMCYQASPTTEVAAGVSEVEDRFGVTTNSKFNGKPLICHAAGLDDDYDLSSIGDTQNHLLGSRLGGSTVPNSSKEQVYRLDGLVGPEEVAIQAPGALLLPAAAQRGEAMPQYGSSPYVDALRCYKARPSRAPRVAHAVKVSDLTGLRTVYVKDPTKLCIPASIDGEDPGAVQRPGGLLCYKAKPCRNCGDASPKDMVEAAVTRLGGVTLQLDKLDSLCTAVTIEPVS